MRYLDIQLTERVANNSSRIRTLGNIKLYHGTKKNFSRVKPNPRNGFVWWTPNKEWAKLYGDKIHTRNGKGLRIVEITAETAREAAADLAEAGIDLTGLPEPYEGDDDYPEEEVHQYIGGTPGLADRIKAAGFDGVMHPDIRYDDGIGVAIALV